MTQPSRLSGADFNPMTASVYGPNRITLESGEAGIDRAQPWILVMDGVSIRTPRGLFGWEVEALGKAQSVSSLMIEVLSDGGCDKFTAEMVIVHDGIAYQIIGRRPTDYRRGICPYQVMTTDDFNSG